MKSVIGARVSFHYIVLCCLMRTPSNKVFLCISVGAYCLAGFWVFMSSPLYPFSTFIFGLAFSLTICLSGLGAIPLDATNQ